MTRSLKHLFSSSLEVRYTSNHSCADGGGACDGTDQGAISGGWLEGLDGGMTIEMLNNV